MTPTPFYTDDLLAWLTAGWLDDDPVRSVRGDDDVRWSDAADDSDDDDYPFWTPMHLRREVA